MPPAEPDRLFAVGDIHGCAGELTALLGSLPLRTDTTVVFLGDYIDRGPGSREVIDTVLALRSICRVVTLIGNHEQMLLAFLEDPRSAEGGSYLFNGGGATLSCYADGDGRYRMPADHLQFLQGLELFHETETELFVHAGVPDLPLEELDLPSHRDALLWIREPFLSTAFRWSKTIVHGHTHGPRVDVRPNRINLDTGCIFGGSLSAMGFPSRRVYSVPRVLSVPALHLHDESSERGAIRFPGDLPVWVQGAGNFLTLNYSEIGLLIVPLEGARSLTTGTAINGTIHPHSRARVIFNGRVVRAEAVPGAPGTAYAIAIERTITVDELSEI